MKVFCKNCKWITVDSFSSYCTCPKNVFDNWYESGMMRKHPRELNKNNDCKWFKKVK
jgi:hypothetical protein